MSVKNIIFVHLVNDLSGSPKVLSQIITIYKSSGHHCELLTANSAHGFLNNSKLKTHPIPYTQYRNKLAKLFSYLYSQIFLFIYCFKFKRDNTLFYINTMLPFGAALAAFCMNKPVIYHIHETSIRPQALKYILRAIVKLTASKVIFVSKYLLHAEDFGMNDQQVIYNCVKSNTSTSIPCHQNFNILMVCSLKIYKGVMDYVEIASILSPNKKIKFTLLLNSETYEIDRFFANCNLPSNLYIYPKSTDTDKFYRKANIVLNLSDPGKWIETFGLTILEAMTYGIPTIVPVIGGPTEIVRDNIDGYHIPSHKHQTIADTISELHKNLSQYESLSKQCIAQSRKFSYEKFRISISNIINHNSFL